MARTEIKYDDYKVKAFLDTNIILEGRPLADLPWHEIDAVGPIIALLTPTGIKEVDSKKQDGRIGKRAREFNRLIAPVAAGGPAIVIRESAPRVELALAWATRIPWDQHGDLDPEDGDSRIVAEMLHARNMSATGKLLVSHDIKPISFATNYDIATLHVSDSWLRQPEPSPADKELQKLKTRIAEYEAVEPDFEIKIDLLDGEPVPVFRIEDLNDTEREHIKREIFSKSSRRNQNYYGFSAISLGYDASYDDRYEAYLKQIPMFMANYAQRLERHFNQARFSLTVANTGMMQAENLLVEVHVSSGWLHDRYVYVSPLGPTVPQPRNDMLIPAGLIHRMPSPRPGRHEVVFKDKPRWGSSFSLTCEDFRHGRDWTYKGLVGIDPRASETKIIVIVSASNFRGKAQKVKLIERKQETVHISKVVDLKTFKITTSTPLDEALKRREPGHDEIDWKAFANYDDDEG